MSVIRLPLTILGVILFQVLLMFGLGMAFHEGTRLVETRPSLDVACRAPAGEARVTAQR